VSGDPLWVVLGAAPGAWLRFWLVNRLEPWLPRRHWGTVLVNVSACLLLGLVMGLEGRGLLSSGAVTLLATGFLGSYSTLSTFLAEVQRVLGKGELAQALGLATTAVLGGLLALMIGLALVSVR